MAKLENDLQKQKIITLEESNLSRHTISDYEHRLKQFYKNSPIDSLQQLIDTPTDELQYILVEYTKFLVNRVKKDELSPNTVPKMFKGIKYVLDVNYRENDIRWKPIQALFPAKVRKSGYKSWTTEQIQEMEKYSKTTRNLALLHFMSSIGGRVGIHEHPLLMKHLVPMSTTGNNIKSDCYAVLLYAGIDESAEEKDEREAESDNMQHNDSYWAFLTPEATKYLKKYHNQRLRSGEQFNDNTPIFRILYQTKYANQNVKQLSRAGVISLVSRILSNTSISRTKKGRRYDTQIDHGFRKRFNTIMKLENTVNSNIAEKILGHKNGLDGVYFTPTREQCFKEFVKAIPELTISPEERQKIQLEKLQEEKTELEQTIEKNSNLEETVTKQQSELKDIKKFIAEERERRIKKDNRNHS